MGLVNLNKMHIYFIKQVFDTDKSNITSQQHNKLMHIINGNIRFLTLIIDKIAQLYRYFCNRRTTIIVDDERIIDSDERQIIMDEFYNNVVVNHNHISHYMPTIRYRTRIKSEHLHIKGFEVTGKHGDGNITFTLFKQIHNYRLQNFVVTSTVNYDIVACTIHDATHYYWFFSRKSRNKLQHMLHGNIHTCDNYYESNFISYTIHQGESIPLLCAKASN